MIYIICGVSGTGKTTIGKLLSNHLEIPFFDADDFHPVENIEKMSSGKPLTDEDRLSWLNDMARRIQSWNKEKEHCVLACSALKQSYRDILSHCNDEEVQWVVLEGSPSLIQSRIKKRKGHFFNDKLLISQFESYQKPLQGWFFNIAKPASEIVDEILSMINSKTQKQ